VSASHSTLRLVTAATALVAAVTCGLVLFETSGIHIRHSVAIAAVILVLLTFFHTRPKRTVRTGDHVDVVNLDEVLFVPTLLMLEPWQSFLVILLASLAGGLMAHRAMLKTIFNLAMMTLAASAGLAVVHALGSTQSASPDVYDALAGMAGALVFTSVSALSTRAMVALATGANYLHLAREVIRQLGPWCGAVTLGGVAAITVGAYPLSVVLVLGVVIFVHRAYAATFGELTARQEAERLQAAVISLRSRTDPEQVRHDLLTAARDLLGARNAEIVGAGEDPPRSLSAPLRDGERLRVEQRLGVEQWDERDRNTLLALAGVAGDVLRSAELIARLRTITDSQSEGVIALDMSANITFVNPAAVEMMGASDASDLLGAPIQDKLVLRQRRWPIDFPSMVARQHAAQDADATLGPLDGDTLDIAYSITPLRAEGAHVGAVLVLRDVTERRAFQDELTRRALHDELTGLPNRRLLQERLDHAVARSSGTGLQHGLLFLDLDRFKLVNDSYGHLVGDKLLIQVANRLTRALSPGDSVARMSGDEFVILVEDANEIERVTSVAERILLTLQEPFEVEGHHIFMSASIGVGLTHQDQRRDEVFAMVDAAAYAAKAAGRNCYCVSTDASVNETRARLDLEVRLRRGLDEDELELHYQPIVTTETGDIVGVEALVRWQSPTRGMMWPMQFVPLAEETGLIVPMGRWVLEESCRTLHEWTTRYPERPPLTVSVNLSALQFAQHRLTENVAETLEFTGLPASQLCLEITETVLMGDTAATQATLDSLHELGVRVAIDDFGTGYSSLSYLKRFSIDVVKLDRSFIEGLVSDPVDAEIAAAVLRLSAALNINTVAEGVETEAQRRMLAQMGCPLMQGFLTARPLTADKFLDFWDEHQPASNLVSLDLHRKLAEGGAGH
jgi:diguanylate cyclase (GGDEF)-like protein/PAS domain S-box-containing protein